METEGKGMKKLLGKPGVMANIMVYYGYASVGVGLLERVSWKGKREMRLYV